GNLIANNDDGVRVTGGGTDGNSILGNSIHSNNELGIDIATDGVNPNDAGDADTGSNQEQNFPNVASATSGSTTVTGTLNSVANQTFRIEAFWSTVCDPSGNGEGANFLGSVDTSTNGAGNASWTITSASTAPNGSFVSTTATRLSGAAPDGDTSEFSGCHVVTGAPGPGPGPQTLEVTPETDANPPSTAHTMTATVSGGASVSGVNVDGEIITGPNTNQTPAGPDLTCTTGVTGTCTATYTGSATQGTDVIRFHIDANNDSAIPGEADATEGQDELVAPGAVAEPDVTDVVSKSFTTAQTLNLEPESDTNPPSTAHTITATVGGGGPIASQNIDAEIISGPNANLNPAGPDLTCTSSASGTCTMTYTGGTGTGTDLIRGHIDANNDNAVPGEADTAEGRPETTTPGTTAEPDTTDVVEKIWAVTQPPPPAGCVGTAGNDILVGTNGPDNCRGRAGNDTIRTKGGRDTGRGGSGNDTLRLGAGNDSGFGGSGNDRIFCGPGRRDQVRGGPGNDRANRACEFGRL
ncbi:MAG: calcium-binding protein, partial [Actinomycetota bacterium]